MLTLFIIFTGMLIVFPVLNWRRRNIDLLLNRWLNENEFKMIKYQEKVFTPFFGSRAGDVVFLDIETPTGEKKKCWLRLSGPPSQYKAECIWNE